MADIIRTPELSNMIGTQINSTNTITTPNGTGFVTFQGDNTIGYVTQLSANPDSWGYVGSDYAQGSEQMKAFQDKNGKIHYKVRKFTPKKVKGSKAGKNDSNNRLAVLSPIVIYKFVKDRFKLLEQSRLTSRLEKIASLMENARVLGQIAMADKIQDRFGKLLREQEMLACGYTKAITRKLADTFINAATPKIIKLTPLKNYVRIIPKNVQRVIDEVKKKKLFDDLLVMHTDVNNTAVAKTREEKKDPILFGVINEAPDTLYFIIDWVDELCDLTLDKLLDGLNLDKSDVAMEADVEKAFIDAIL